MKRRTHSDEFKKQVIEEYLAGTRMSEIIRKYTIDKKTVKIWRNKYLSPNLTDARGKSRRVHSCEFKNQVVEEYFSGIEAKELAKKYSVSRKSIAYWLDKYNKLGTCDERGKNGTLKSIKTVDTTKMSKDEYICYLEMENDILKQIRSLSNNR